MNLRELTPADVNPRTISDAAFVGLMQSIERFGMVEPIVWNERTQRIVGGHQRRRALLEQGIEEMEVVVVDISKEEEMALNITLNNPEIEGMWDTAALVPLLDGMDSQLMESLNIDALETELLKDDNDGEDFDEHICPCCGNIVRV